MFGRFIPLPDFLYQSASTLLCYPATELTQERIDELASLDVAGVYDFGSKRIGQWHCLGVGYCGLVLLVQFRGRTAALKVRRIGAPKDSFEMEAQGLAIANQTQVGPQLLAHTPNFLVMSYASGQPISDWLSEAPSRNIVLKVTQNLLTQAYRLDQAGLDHGNLRCVTRHVVVEDNQSTVLDFSSASCDRRCANVTTLTQGLFWGTVIAQQMKDIGISPKKENCIKQLRQYKQAPNFNNFEALLNLLG